MRGGDAAVLLFLSFISSVLAPDLFFSGIQWVFFLQSFLHFQSFRKKKSEYFFTKSSTNPVMGFFFLLCRKPIISPSKQAIKVNFR
jgi:hypothetical protein